MAAIDGTQEIDTLTGTAEDDLIRGFNGSDVLFGEDGNDTLVGARHEDYLEGGDGDDLLDGGSDVDTLYGGEGNDILNGGSHSDHLIGGNGDDIYYYSQQFETVIEEVNGGIDTVIFADAEFTTRTEDSLRRYDFYLPDNVEILRVSGLYSLAVFHGNDLDNIISGDGGRQYFNGGRGNDLLINFGGVTLGGRNGFIFEGDFGHDTIDDKGSIGDIAFFLEFDFEEFTFLANSDNDLIVRHQSGNSVTIIDGASNSLAGIERFEFANGVYGREDILSQVFIYGTDNSETLNGSDANDNIFAYGGNDIVNGSYGNDNLQGFDGDDELDGSFGADNISGGNGNDIIIAGIGGDTLRGGLGDDIFRYNHLEDGPDLIVEYWDKFSDAGNDTLQLTQTTIDQVTFSAVNDNLVLDFENGSGILTIAGQLDINSPGYRVETISFADGSTLNYQEIYSLLETVGTEDSESLFGSNYGETILGLAGDDLVLAYGGDDTIYGGTGVDTLSGFQGNDSLYGGEGNDILRGAGDDDILEGGVGDDDINGGDGNDVYRYALGDGSDYIFDGHALGTYGGIDEIRFLDINLSDVNFAAHSNNLELQFTGSSDIVTIAGQLLNDPARLIETFIFQDISLTSEQVAGLI